MSVVLVLKTQKTRSGRGTRGYNRTIMLLVPEARAAMVRAAIFAAIAIPCAIGALRIQRRWARIVLLVFAIPATFEAIFGIWAIWLIQHYASR